MRQLTVSLSLVFLGICILLGAWLVASSIKNNFNSHGEINQVEMVTRTNDQLMSHLELQEYLGINGEELSKILPREEDNVIKSKIPYIKIGYKFYFPVNAIDKWLTETEAETFR